MLIELDNVIIGGGPVGLISAISLANLGYSSIIFDMNDSINKSHDGRILSISYASYQYLLSIGISIPHHFLTPICQVHISHNGFGVSRIDSNLIASKELGYTISYADLYNVLYQKSKQINSKINFINKEVCDVKSYSSYSIIECRPGDILSSNNTIKSSRLIMAEGGKLSNNLTQYDTYNYNQMAIISQISCDIHHQNIAYERFDKLGVMALLPYQSNYVLVFVVDKSNYEFLYNQNYCYDYLLQNNFIKKLGKFNFVGDNKSFPLSLKLTKNRVINNILLLGSSAQVINPIVAQGLNLSIRDIKIVSNLIAKYGELDFTKLAKNYNNLRRDDIMFVKHFTHNLSIINNSKLFHSFLPLGLVMFDNSIWIKKSLLSHLVFGH